MPADDESSRAGGVQGQPVNAESIDIGWVRARYERAHEQIRANILPSTHCAGRVLTTAPFFGKQMYAEISALESLLYAKHDPEVALATHEAFFNRQREDGLIPSVSMADPTFDPKPVSDWSGSSIVSIVARALLWMPYYGKEEDLEIVMRRWVAAWSRADKLETIMHPIKGSGYPNCIWADMTSTLIQFMEFVDRLGLLKTPDSN